MNNILITGSSGFLGSHLVDLLEEKKFNITLFDSTPSKYSNNNNQIIGDILDENLIDEAVKGCETVFHFAALADIDKSTQFPKETLNTNILGTLNVLRACVKYKVKRIIFSSSIYVYSKYGSFYRVSKQACEKLVEEYQREYNLDFTILRFGSLYGPRSTKGNSIYNMITNIMNDSEIKRDGNGEEIREYIHVKDAAQLAFKLIDDKYSNQYFMITGKQSLKIKELMIILKEIFQKDFKVIYNKNSNHHYEVTPFSYDNIIAKKITPEIYIDLGQGILDTIYEIEKNK